MPNEESASLSEESSSSSEETSSSLGSEEPVVAPKTRKDNYLQFLEQADILENLLTVTNKSPNTIQDIWKNDGLEARVKNLDETIRKISLGMVFKKAPMLRYSIMNVIVRIAAIDTSDFIITQTSFQSMYIELHDQIQKYDRRPQRLSSECVISIFNSILANLAKDNFIDICLNRISTEDGSPNVSISLPKSVHSSSSSCKLTPIDFHDILSSYIEYATHFAYSITLLPELEFKINCWPLMVSFQVFISDLLNRTDENVPQTVLTMAEHILGFLWELTDKIRLLPMLKGMDFSEKTIEWIGTDGFTRHIDQLGESILTIVYNLSRDKTSLRQFCIMNAFDILIERRQFINDQNNEDLTEMFGMLLVSLVTNDEQLNKNEIFIRDTTVDLYQYCEKASEDQGLRTNGTHLSEYLELLYRAFSNTYLIKNTLNEDRIRYFVELLLSFYGVALDPKPDYLEKRAVNYLLKILLEISKYPDYREQLKSNDQFYLVIECLAARSKQSDAKHIRNNIKDTKANSPTTLGQMTSSMIYISYDRHDGNFCIEFAKELRRKITLPVWFEYENLELYDDVWEYLYPIIKSAKAIVVLMSRDYDKNTEKFQELTYISRTTQGKTTGIKLIVVNVEPNFTCKKIHVEKLLPGKIEFPYTRKIRKIASKVSQEIVPSEKRTCQCLPFRRRRDRQETTLNTQTESVDDPTRT